MQSLEQYKHYLILLLLLVLAKFVWVPLWDSKAEYWQTQQQAERNLVKTQALLLIGGQMSEQQQQMQALVEKLENAMTQTKDITSFKLNIQSQLEKLVKTHQLEISSSDWREGLLKDDIQTLLLDLRLVGKTKHYIEFFAAMQKIPDLRQLVVVSQSFSVRGQNDTSMGSINGQVSVSVSVKLKAAT